MYSEARNYHQAQLYEPQLVGAVEYLDKSFFGRTLFWQHKMTANIILGWVIIPGSIEHYGQMSQYNYLYSLLG